MNKLSYKRIDEQKKIIPDSPNCPEFRIVLDGRETIYFFVPQELEKSSKEPGIYGIVVCACGVEYCGGAEVEVLHQGNEIIWQRMWHTDWDGESPEDEQRPFVFEEIKTGTRLESPFRFNKKEYQGLVASLQNTQAVLH